MGWGSQEQAKVNRQEHYKVTTETGGSVRITFDPPFTNPHVTFAVQAERSDERVTTAEFTALSGDGVTIRTVLQGSSAFVPTKFETATVHVTITELG